MESAVRLEHVEAAVGGAVVLRDVSLEVAPGELLALIGPSGSGKTTLLRVISGFVAPRAGSVFLSDRLASAPGRILLPPETRNVGMVFQDLALWPHLTVEGNLAFGLRAKRVASRTTDERITGILERVGLLTARTRYPGQLSGGERQRVAIARAFVLDPEVLLLDEPFANLDLVRRRELRTLLGELLRERKVSAILVTHEAQDAALADRLAILEHGALVQHGTATELAARPATEFVRLALEDIRASAT